MTPLAPAVMDVPSDSTRSKTMLWPLDFAKAGEETPPDLSGEMVEKAKKYQTCILETVPATVVAVGSFADASTEPVVRGANARLKQALERDGITVPEAGDNVKFAQYDAIYTLGKRRGEVWIELADGCHPWSSF